MSTEFQPEWRQTRVGRESVRYQVAGEGPPLILLHGLSGSVAWWQRNMKVLAREFRVHAVDLLYYGTRRGARFVLAQTAERITAWMKVLGLERAAFIGHSMGGYIAASIAAEHPEVVSKLVLVNAAAIFPSHGPRLAINRLVRWLPTFPPTLAPVLLRDAVRAGPFVLWEATRDLLSSDFRPRLSAVTAQTLIIWGEQDGILSIELARELHQALPNSELHILPDAGHNPMWESPEEFNELVLRFLREA